MRRPEGRIPAPDGVSGRAAGDVRADGPPAGGPVSALTRELTNERIVADAGAYADLVLGQPEVGGSAIGTTGTAWAGGCR